MIIINIMLSIIRVTQSIHTIYCKLISVVCYNIVELLHWHANATEKSARQRWMPDADMEL